VRAAWTRERLAGLAREELINLQANAARLGETELARLCGEALNDASCRSFVPASDRLRKTPRLVARGAAFGARGVRLLDERASWSGVRPSDGTVVIAIWRAVVQARNGTCACLLWAPNVGGARPWSDTAAGRERLEHCRLALQRGGAEALLVHGDELAGRLPEDRARSIWGVDIESRIRFQVEARKQEYWAVWGRSRTPVASA